MRWRRFLCRVFGHRPIDPKALRFTCRRCGLVEKACDWCGVNGARAKSRLGNKIEYVCRPCVGVP